MVSVLFPTYVSDEQASEIRKVLDACTHDKTHTLQRISPAKLRVPRLPTELNDLVFEKTDFVTAFIVGCDDRVLKYLFDQVLTTGINAEIDLYKMLFLYHTDGILTDDALYSMICYLQTSLQHEFDVKQIQIIIQGGHVWHEVVRQACGLCFCQYEIGQWHVALVNESVLRVLCGMGGLKYVA